MADVAGVDAQVDVRVPNEAEGESDHSDDGVDEDYDFDDETEHDHSNCNCHSHEPILPPSLYLARDPNPDLPDTVTTLKTPDGSTVYLVGTAHFSESSQEDVSKTIQNVTPDVVMVELCRNRVNILQLDEKTLLEEAKNLNWEKMRATIRQSGVLQGMMHILLLSMSAHLTRQLGMAPGGEFRRAFKEAQQIHGCRVVLGDRPIQVTLRRALGSLGVWQKIRLAWCMLASRESISKEEVEKCKQKDLLEEMLKEMTGEFPALSRVFVSERDEYLAHSLRSAAQSIPHPDLEDEKLPCVVVGVVGIGHVPGIVQNWEKEANIEEIMRIPKSGYFGTAFKWTMRAVLVGLMAWGGYKLIRVTI